MKCKNCEHSVTGNFCFNCGQKTTVQRINFEYLVNEFSDSVLQINRGLLFTIKELFTNPGHSIRQYLEGKRKPHVKPLAYILLLSTIYVLVSQFFDESTVLGGNLRGFMKGFAESTDQADGEPTIGRQFITWLSNNYAIASLLFLPLFSFVSYSVFKRFEYNYWEHIVLNAFITGQQTLIYTVLVILNGLITPSGAMESISLLLSNLFLFWTFSQFFKGEKLHNIVGLTCWAYFLFYTFLFTLLILIGFSGR